MSNMKTPLVSVIMPVHNDEKYVWEAIESIIAQTFTDFEFIIVNDGSNDTTGDVLSRYAAKDRRIRSIKQKNAGLTVTLNRMIRSSRGMYVARQDSDDISEPDRIEKQLSVLNKHPELMMIGTSAKLIDEQGKILKYERCKTGPLRLRKILMRKNAFVHGSVMFNKDIFDKAGFYYEEFKYAEDYDLFMRISEKHLVDNIPEYLYRYRISSNAISYRHISEQLRMGMIVSNVGRLRRNNLLTKWDKATYDSISNKPDTFFCRRILDYRVSLSRGGNLLITGKRWEAFREFLWAFICFPFPNALYHAFRAMIGWKYL